MIERVYTNEFKAELTRLLANEVTGFTYSPNRGIVLHLEGQPFDVVTLASVNVSPVGLTIGAIDKALEPYYDIMGRRGSVPFCIGLFSFIDKDGEETISIDLNVVVHQSFRANSMAFAADNSQVAIYDFRRQCCVPTGGSGQTRVSTPDNIFKAAEALVDGRPVEVTIGGDVISQTVCSVGPGHRWRKVVTPAGKESPYQYLNRQGQILGECDHTTSLTAFGEAWWKCQGQEGRLANVRQCRQHIEEMVAKSV